MYHALYDPFVVNFGIEEAPEYLSVQACQIGEENQAIGIFNVSLNILDDYYIGVDEL